jgi:hypothetical protein
MQRVNRDLDCLSLKLEKVLLTFIFLALQTSHACSTRMRGLELDIFNATIVVQELRVNAGGHLATSLSPLNKWASVGMNAM